MNCPTCGKSLRTERGPRQHHTKVHGDPLPTRTRTGCGTAFSDSKARREFCADCHPKSKRRRTRRDLARRDGNDEQDRGFLRTLSWDDAWLAEHVVGPAYQQGRAARSNTVSPGDGFDARRRNEMTTSISTAGRERKRSVGIQTASSAARSVVRRSGGRAHSGQTWLRSVGAVTGESKRET